jgi:NAD(P)H dehydrogenase (quinone)
MPKALVVYYSRTGHTKKMAEMITEGLREEGIDVTCKSVTEASVDEIQEYDGLIVGSPTYYGTMAAEVKKFLDDSVKFHGRLDGMVGGAFASAAVTGHETTVMSIIQALLIHGMIVQGDPSGHHYGPTAVGKVEGSEKQCRRFAKRFADLLKRLS